MLSGLAPPCAHRLATALEPCGPGGPARSPCCRLPTGPCRVLHAARPVPATPRAGRARNSMHGDCSPACAALVAPSERPPPMLDSACVGKVGSAAGNGAEGDPAGRSRGGRDARPQASAERCGEARGGVSRHGRQADGGTTPTRPPRCTTPALHWRSISRAADWWRPIFSSTI